MLQLAEERFVSSAEDTRIAEALGAQQHPTRKRFITMKIAIVSANDGRMRVHWQRLAHSQIVQGHPKEASCQQHAMSRSLLSYSHLTKTHKNNFVT